MDWVSMQNTIILVSFFSPSLLLTSSIASTSSSGPNVWESLSSKLHKYFKFKNFLPAGQKGIYKSCWSPPPATEQNNDNIHADWQITDKWLSLAPCQVPNRKTTVLEITTVRTSRKSSCNSQQPERTLQNVCLMVSFCFCYMKGF